MGLKEVHEIDLKNEEKEFSKRLYSLNLGRGMDSLSNNFWIERVAGGWIYLDKSHNISVFVPFDNEFMVNEMDDDVRF